jgi:hypothetical protein
LGRWPVTCRHCSRWRLGPDGQRTGTGGRTHPQPTRQGRAAARVVLRRPGILRWTRGRPAVEGPEGGWAAGGSPPDTAPGDGPGRTVNAQAPADGCIPSQHGRAVRQRGSCYDDREFFVGPGAGRPLRAWKVVGPLAGHLPTLLPVTARAGRSTHRHRRTDAFPANAAGPCGSAGRATTIGNSSLDPGPAVEGLEGGWAAGRSPPDTPAGRARRRTVGAHAAEAGQSVPRVAWRPPPDRRPTAANPARCEADTS